AVSADPTSVRYHRTLAEWELRQNHPNVAAFREEFEKALALDPNDVSARIDYAKSLEGLGLTAEAIDQYRIALQKNEQLAPDEPKRLDESRVNALKHRVGGG